MSQKNNKNEKNRRSADIYNDQNVTRDEDTTQHEDIPSLSDEDKKTIEFLKNIPAKNPRDGFKEELKETLMIEYANKRKKKKRRMIKISSAVAACFLITIISLTLWSDITDDRSPEEFFVQTEEAEDEIEKESKDEMLTEEAEAEEEDEAVDDGEDDKPSIMEAPEEELDEEPKKDLVHKLDDQLENKELSSEQALELAKSFNFNQQDILEKNNEFKVFETEEEILEIDLSRGIIEYSQKSSQEKVSKFSVDEDEKKKNIF
ncbi:hypothetical protein [Natranaerofaba carboxydovora]|uniref:hypothetical protein n=1 Tax=Natranaerofaba carboxydovora TaxID=2742683 RepID=UPI001F142B8A|nr:hypothetical protein [Natranaerofaba carboxydovora]UMZ75331.1 hypothetical protein ACONDI_02954 [Natranaerofaba carboxydovora]